MLLSTSVLSHPEEKPMLLTRRGAPWAIICDCKYKNPRARDKSDFANALGEPLHR